MSPVARFVDTHVHSWDTSEQHHPWLADRADLPPQPGLPAEAQTAAAGVTGLLLVEAGVAVRDVSEETARLLALANSDHRVLGVIAAVHAGVKVAAPSGVVGVRLNIRDWSFHQNSVETLSRVLADAAALGLPLDVLSGWSDLAIVSSALEAVPGATVVIDHLGDPPQVHSPSEWLESLIRLARFPNCQIKLSGLPHRDARAAALLQLTLDVMGSRNCMLGSDWPVTEKEADYGNVFGFMTRQLGDRLDDNVASLNAIRVYRIDARSDHG